MVMQYHTRGHSLKNPSDCIRRAFFCSERENYSSAMGGIVIPDEAFTITPKIIVNAFYNDWNPNTSNYNII